MTSFAQQLIVSQVDWGLHEKIKIINNVLIAVQWTVGSIKTVFVCQNYLLDLLGDALWAYKNTHAWGDFLFPFAKTFVYKRILIYIFSLNSTVFILHRKKISVDCCDYASYVEFI